MATAYMSCVFRGSLTYVLQSFAHFRCPYMLVFMKSMNTAFNHIFNHSSLHSCYSYSNGIKISLVIPLQMRMFLHELFSVHIAAKLFSLKTFLVYSILELACFLTSPTKHGVAKKTLVLILISWMI